MSVSIAAATVLLLTAALAALLSRRAKSPLQRYIQLGAFLYAVSAAVLLMPTNASAHAITLFVLAAAPTALVLAVYTKFVRDTAVPTAFAALGASMAAAIAALAFALPVLAFLPLLANTIALCALGLAHWRAGRRESALVLAAALSLAASASAYLHGGLQAEAPFAAAALLGIALLVSQPSDVRVEQKRGRWARRTLAVRRKR